MKNLKTFVLFTVVFLAACHTLSVTASAIPMWEFLSRGEKMRFLLRVFTEQVIKYCEDSSMPDCYKNLLVSGTRNLYNMDNNVLDQLDPYQHDAKGLIWRAMIKNAYSPRLGQPDEFYFSIGNDALAMSDSDINGIGEETMEANDYIQPSSEHAGPYLVGPMVIRVYPDGRPVPEDSTRPLPRDEDMEEFSRSRVPSIEEIEARKDAFYEKRLKGNTFPQNKSHRPPHEESAHLRNNNLLKRRLQEVIAKHKIRYH